MTESSFQPKRLRFLPQLQLEPAVFVRRLIWKLAIATLFLMAVGSATRVMNAGLACPDWPLCYGQLVPANQMNLQVFLEWFHRLDAALIGCGAIALTGLSWWWRKHFPSWLPYASSFALLLIVFQGVLGGLTVTQLLRFDIVTAHLATALLFFSTLIAIATSLLPIASQESPNLASSDTKLPRKLATMGLAATILVYLQSIIGGLVASRWALHQCFAGFQLCNVMNGHIIGVFPPTIVTVVLVWLTRSAPQIHKMLRRLSILPLCLVASQIVLGIATYRLHLQVELLTVTHQMIGAALLGTLVAFTVLARRFSTPSIQ